MLTKATKRFITAALTLLCAAAEVYGYFHYTDSPTAMWAFLDIAPLFAACAFGLPHGLVCLIPTLASELMWVVFKSTYNALLVCAAFLIVVLLLGLLHQAIMHSHLRRFAGASVMAVGFELSLILLRVTNNGLRTLFSPLIKGAFTNYLSLQHALSLFTTWLNPVALALLVILVVLGSRQSASARYADRTFNLMEGKS